METGLRWRFGRKKENMDMNAELAFRWSIKEDITKQSWPFAIPYYVVLKGFVESLVSADSYFLI